MAEAEDRKASVAWMPQENKRTPSQLSPERKNSPPLFCFRVQSQERLPDLDEGRVHQGDRKDLAFP